MADFSGVCRKYIGWVYEQIGEMGENSSWKEETKSKKALKKIIYELKEEMDLKKYDVAEMEMLEEME